ncbi:hypothetical protein ACCD10_19580 [Pseudomonas sp. Pseusp122]|uniref:hypothetical protein n=1 Tax=unclassified Pseudomonas TaxID=196821 RepID=UPI0039A74AC2
MSNMNGIEAKQLNQVISEDGKACPATSAPGWFIKHSSRHGETFANERLGNQVKFFTTGSDYFKDIAHAIKHARKSIYICGWQINYEVRLTGDVRLWDCLNYALRQGAAPDIYLMPWLSPKVAVDTGDMETMVAALLLNAGLDTKKVWCLPAIQQSDMANLGLFFSHHQKMVVIDNEIAYVGGIDLAYGRCDDHNFRLAANGRVANEFYNPCIPPITSIAAHQQYPYLTGFELISAALWSGDLFSKAQRHVGWAKDNKLFNALRHSGQEAGIWLKHRAVDGLRIMGAGGAYTAGGVAYIAEFIHRQLAKDNPQNWQYTLQQWKHSLDEALQVLDEELQTGRRTDGALEALRSDTRLVSDAIGAWHDDPERATTLQQMTDRWLTDAQRQIPRITSLSGPASSRLQARVSRLKGDYQAWAERASAPLDELQQALLAWAGQIQTSGGFINDAQLNRGSELVSLWVQQSGVGAFYAWLNNTPSSIVAAKAVEEFEALATPFLLYLHSVIERRSDAQQGEPYSYLADPDTRLMPAGEVIHDSARQPRMPWHDVHMRLEGPAVQDLSRNFIDRWNSLQARYDGTRITLPSALGSVLKLIQTDLAPVPFKAQYLPQPAEVPKQGSVSVQVLRSASARLRQEEYLGALKAGDGYPPPGGVQANCLQAMLKAISSAQQFIYIENQFFQSDYGQDSTVTTTVVPGPMQGLMSVSALPGYDLYKTRLRLDQVADDPKNLHKIDYFALAEMIRNKEAETFTQGLMQVLTNIGTVESLRRLQPAQAALQNPLCEALAARIERAIEMGEDFHVYMVLPVHPEGPLNVISLMTQVHLTMQSLSLGEQSLVKRIQRSMAIKAQMDKGKTEEQARRAIEDNVESDEMVKRYEEADWSRYLTLLNLRSWELLDRPVTEQIYVHSKLLIADDRVAILGSANINDRSQLGDRDSELAVIVSGNMPTPSPLNGRGQHPVCADVRGLRRQLWRKLFALDVSDSEVKVQPATHLESLIDMPAAPATWQAIQGQALENSEKYEEAFPFIPRNNASIWPLWKDPKELQETAGYSPANVKKGLMPFEKEFWTEAAYGVQPGTIMGFITQLPIHWTKNESNDSQFNLTILANIQPSVGRGADGTRVAALPDNRNTENS